MIGIRLNSSNNAMKYIVLIDTTKNVERVHVCIVDIAGEKKTLTHSHILLWDSHRIFFELKVRTEKSDCYWKII